MRTVWKAPADCFSEYPRFRTSGRRTPPRACGSGARHGEYPDATHYLLFDNREPVTADLLVFPRQAR